MMSTLISKRDRLARLPKEWPESPLPAIQDELSGVNTKLVVLDDDPTGTQTVHGIPVLTDWSVDTLLQELERDDIPGFYILTNSRSLSPDAAWSLNVAIAQNLNEARRRSGRDFALVSRSDSTLRGHFPLEMDALESEVGQHDIWLLVPFFLEGGRYTLDNVHYVAEGDHLLPAAETPFAKDDAFGYTQSNLRKWVAEKSDNRFPAESINSIMIPDLRSGGPSAVAKKLIDLPPRSVCIVNSASYRDQEVLVRGVLMAEAAGKRILYRSAASFVRPRAGIDGRPLLTSEELKPAPSASENGGLVVVGSYVPKTTDQLNYLLAQGEVFGIEIQVEQLLDEINRKGEIERVASMLNRELGQGRDCVIYTGRKLISGRDADESLRIGRIVSQGLVSIVRMLTVQPRYFIAKGGITSSDVATQGLSIKKALILGQILPGIPVWQTGFESRYPHTNYVVFPGNVGDETALHQAVGKLNG